MVYERIYLIYFWEYFLCLDVLYYRNDVRNDKDNWDSVGSIVLWINIG